MTQPNRPTPPPLTQIYTPIDHSNGEKLVQITNVDGGFCGWACDERGKFGITGTWEVSDTWNSEQMLIWARVVKSLKATGFKIETSEYSDGISKTATVFF